MRPQRQGLRYVYKIIDLADDRLSEDHLERLLGPRRSSSASTGSTSPIRSSRRWCRWSTRSAATWRRSAPSTPCCSDDGATRRTQHRRLRLRPGLHRRAARAPPSTGWCSWGRAAQAPRSRMRWSTSAPAGCWFIDPDEGRADALVAVGDASGRPTSTSRRGRRRTCRGCSRQRPGSSTRPRSAWPPTPASRWRWSCCAPISGSPTSSTGRSRPSCSRPRATSVAVPQRCRHGRAPGGRRVRADHRPPRRPRRDVARLRRPGRRRDRTRPQARDTARGRKQRDGTAQNPRGVAVAACAVLAARGARRLRRRRRRRCGRARSRSRWRTATPRTSRSTAAGPRSSRTRSRRPTSG